ncbi:extracellular solute-binding protein [Ktedonobacter sp. SOSP1-52]|uniref:extracellular solute-binding protein n=1 Tax=Ktedonobacter sp. SOSP1-52 TaxID=2778366 RepID=UPI001915C6AC|nr:extracellular solute-binding protein [Ktedonobacter sp. SOSP1-52]
MFANQQGASMVDASGKLQLNSQAYLNIMNFLNRVRMENLGTRAAYFSPGDLAAIDADQVAFYPWAVWAVYGADLLFKKSKGKWRAMPLPAWTKGGARGAVMGGSSFIIPKKAKNPHLAWLFYEHLVFSKEGYSAVYGPNKIYPGGINTSLPSYLPALQTQLYKNSDGLGGQNLWDVATGTVKDIPGNYYIAPWYNQAVPYFGTNVQRMLDGQMTPQQVLQKSSSDIQTKLVDRQ